MLQCTYLKQLGDGISELRLYIVEDGVYSNFIFKYWTHCHSEFFSYLISMATM